MSDEETKRIYDVQSSRVKKIGYGFFVTVLVVALSTILLQNFAIASTYEDTSLDDFIERFVNCLEKNDVGEFKKMLNAEIKINGKTPEISGEEKMFERLKTAHQKYDYRKIYRSQRDRELERKKALDNLNENQKKILELERKKELDGLGIIETTTPKPEKFYLGGHCFDHLNIDLIKDKDWWTIIDIWGCK